MGKVRGTLKAARVAALSSSGSSRRSDNMDRTRDMLIGALDRVFQLAGASGSSQSGSMSTQLLLHNDNNGSVRVGTTILNRRTQMIVWISPSNTSYMNFEPPKASVTSSLAYGRSYTVILMFSEQSIL